jgi:hypothetical protein
MKISLSALVSCAVLSACSGGGSGNSAPPPSNTITLPPGATASPFSGNYDVAYAGDRQGNCAVQIFIDGSVNGRCVGSTGLTENLIGSVTASGAFLSTLGTVASGGEFKGTLTPQNGNGTWSTTLGKVGSWLLTATPPTPAPPTLAQPQSGSAQVIGNGLEGVWRNNLDEPLVLTDSNALYLATTLPLADKVRGAFSASANALVLGSDAIAFSAVGAGPATGNASFTPRSTLGFTYQRSSGGPLGDYTARYDPLNAMAVTLSELGGTWVNTQAPEMSVGASGELSARTVGGLLGDCILSGSISPVSPGTSKNLFAVSLTASLGPIPEGATAALCNAVQGQAYTGYAFVRTVNIGNFSVAYYKPSLQIYVSQDSGPSIILIANRR